jgi:hypothetical protein
LIVLLELELDAPPATILTYGTKVAGEKEVLDTK